MFSQFTTLEPTTLNSGALLLSEVLFKKRQHLVDRIPDDVEITVDSTVKDSDIAGLVHVRIRNPVNFKAGEKFYYSGTGLPSVSGRSTVISDAEALAEEIVASARSDAEAILDGAHKEAARVLENAENQAASKMLENENSNSAPAPSKTGSRGGATKK